MRMFGMNYLRKRCSDSVCFQDARKENKTFSCTEQKSDDVIRKVIEKYCLLSLACTLFQTERVAVFSSFVTARVLSNQRWV